MTHTTTVVHDLNMGSVKAVVADLDITSLDNASSETFDPAAEFTMDEVVDVHVGALENPNSYVVQTAANYDLAVEQYGGTDPTSGTDVGTVRVTVLGDPGP